MFLFFRKKVFFALIVVWLCAEAQSAVAQDNSERALDLVGAAMDAYSNLEMDKAKGLLEQALALKDTIDNVTLAKVYVGFGVLWVGGFTNSSESKTSFIKALCLDESAKVDPLFSTPEIDLAFTEAKSAVSPATCREMGVGGNVSMPPCGMHDPIPEQKAGYEVPFYVDVDPSVRFQLSGIAVKYAFDNKGQFRTLVLDSIGDSGYGALVTCDKGEIRTANPDSVQYYIEGYDSNNNVICGHGSEETPMDVIMGNDVPIIRRPGLDPVSCTAPVAKKDVGESCMMESECKEGLKCNDDFKCEGERGGEGTTPTPTTGKGPKKFYVTLTGGAGFGYINKDVVVNTFNSDAETVPINEDSTTTVPTRGVIETNTNKAGGTGWSGVPIRLTIGYKFTPKLSAEISARVDGFVVSYKNPISCWDDSGASPTTLRQFYDGTKCSTDIQNSEALYTDDEVEYVARRSGVLKDGKVRQEIKYQVPWIINARVRYQFLTKGGLQSSFFGGVGYGHIQYRVPDTGSNLIYYPLVGMVDIDLGIGLAYYFTKNVGLVFDVPIDFMVGDGFSVNFDFNLGLGFGF